MANKRREFADKERAVLFYHGSLVELNSRKCNEQYTFADKTAFNSDGYITHDISNKSTDWLDQIRRQLISEGFDGLVNYRANFYELRGTPHAVVEGTPIVRIKSQ